VTTPYNLSTPAHQLQNPKHPVNRYIITTVAVGGKLMVI
jgi:hypothetical protein